LDGSEEGVGERGQRSGSRIGKSSEEICRQEPRCVVPTGKAIEESVDLAFEVFNLVFRRVPEKMNER